MTRQETINLLQIQFGFLIKRKVISWATSKFLFLAWGPFAPLVSYFAGELADFIAKDGEMRIFFVYTDLRVEKEGRDWLNAMADYQNAKQSGAQDEIERKEKILKDVFARLIILKS